MRFSFYVALMLAATLGVAATAQAGDLASTQFPAGVNLSAAPAPAPIAAEPLQPGEPMALLATDLVTEQMPRPTPTTPAPTRTTPGELPQLMAAPPADGPGRAVFAPLYVSFAALQIVDAHSTFRALANGGREANPVLAPIAGNKPAMFAVKAATTAGIVLITERVRKRNPKAALALMIGLNAAYALIASHNYRVASEMAGAR